MRYSTGVGLDEGQEDNKADYDDEEDEEGEEGEEGENDDDNAEDASMEDEENDGRGGRERTDLQSFRPSSPGGLDMSDFEFAGDPMDEDTGK